MESLQNIKRRLSGVKNIGQITKAMELVAATKMRRSQEIALDSRPYAFAALDLLGKLTSLTDAELPDLLQTRTIEKSAFVVITSDKGLAGSFNSSILRKFDKYISDENIDLADDSNSFIAVGQKANNHLNRRAHGIAETFTRFGDYTTIKEVRPLVELLIEGYRNKDWDRVVIFSANFKSALNQEVLVRQIMPIDIEDLKRVASEIVPETGKFAELIKSHRVSFFEEDAKSDEYLIEPSPEKVLERLVPHLVEMQIYHIILEANASEHAARRMAMKSASDNAKDLSEDLTIKYNKSRQTAITTEISEISAGAEALSK